MKIGVPKEIKNHEYRVGLTPDSVRELVAHGHEVVVETGAGAGIGALDDDYEAAGASILSDAASVFSAATMIVKVKEPQAIERAMLRPHHILFTHHTRQHAGPWSHHWHDVSQLPSAHRLRWAANISSNSLSSRLLSAMTAGLSMASLSSRSP